MAERQRLVRDFGIMLHLLETCFAAVRAGGVSWPVGGRGVRDSAFNLAATMPSPENSLKARFPSLPGCAGRVNSVADVVKTFVDAMSRNAKD